MCCIRKLSLSCIVQVGTNQLFLSVGNKSFAMQITAAADFGFVLLQFAVRRPRFNHVYCLIPPPEQELEYAYCPPDALAILLDPMPDRGLARVRLYTVRRLRCAVDDYARAVFRFRNVGGAVQSMGHPVINDENQTNLPP